MLHGAEVAAAEIPALDEVPVLAWRPRAGATTEFRDVAELRVKETDRMVAIAELVVHAGRAQVAGDDLGWSVGGPRSAAAALRSGGDHRLAMAAPIAAAAARARAGPVAGWATLATSYSGFV